MRNLLKSLPLSLLVLLFIYAAASKLLDFGEFRGQLYNQTFPRWVADLLLYGLPPVEIIAAVLLLFPRTEMTGLLITFDLLLLFSGYIILVLVHFWDRVPCSCGGVLSHMGWGTHLIFNLAFIGLNIAAIRIRLKDKNIPG